MDEQNTNTQSTEKKSSNGGLIAIIGIIVIVLVGVVGYQTMNKQQTTTTNQTQSPAMQQQTTENTQPTTGSGEAATAAYKDGTYTAVGNYTSPGGQEELGVTLTIADGVVTDSTVEVKATRPISKERQTDFAEHYKTQVVGKSIDEISLTKVSGSSLSPKGFNDAVSKIKTEAGA